MIRRARGSRAKAKPAAASSQVAVNGCAPSRRAGARGGDSPGTVPDSVVERPLRIPALDRYSVGATLFAPSGGREPLIAAVFASGGDVPAARYLASNGVPVLTFDCHGSATLRPARLRGFRATVEDGSEFRCRATIAHLQTTRTRVRQQAASAAPCGRPRGSMRGLRRGSRDDVTTSDTFGRRPTHRRRCPRHKTLIPQRILRTRVEAYKLLAEFPC
jgi:anti-sigma factor RsiW